MWPELTKLPVRKPILSGCIRGECRVVEAAAAGSGLRVCHVPLAAAAPRARLPHCCVPSRWRKQVIKGAVPRGQLPSVLTYMKGVEQRLVETQGDPDGRPPGAGRGIRLR